MKTGGETTALEKLLRPLPLQFTTDLARALVNLRADSEVQSRYDMLSQKRSEGTLLPTEVEELEAMVRANTLLGLLQAEARLVLIHTKAN